MREGDSAAAAFGSQGSRRGAESSGRDAPSGDANRRTVRDVFERRRYEVRGRVQGVGFRAWTLHHGRELGLAGTVRNRADGCVEVDAAGPAAALDRLEQLLHRGPRFAAVTDVRRLEHSAARLPTSFQIGY
jgi:acylphosphatase